MKYNIDDLHDTLAENAAIETEKKEAARLKHLADEQEKERQRLEEQRVFLEKFADTIKHEQIEDAMLKAEKKAAEYREHVINEEFMQHGLSTPKEEEKKKIFLEFARTLPTMKTCDE